MSLLGPEDAGRDGSRNLKNVRNSWVGYKRRRIYVSATVLKPSTVRIESQMLDEHRTSQGDGKRLLVEKQPAQIRGVCVAVLLLYHRVRRSAPAVVMGYIITRNVLGSGGPSPSLPSTAPPTASCGDL